MPTAAANSNEKTTFALRWKNASHRHDTVARAT
jgi:hypothetical protein